MLADQQNELYNSRFYACYQDEDLMGAWKKLTQQVASALL